MTSTVSMPSAVNDGYRVPTLNTFGWMLTKVIDPIDQFIELAAKSPHWALEIGCAYGVHTTAAINAGARVVANDLEPKHLEILQANLPPEQRAKLKTVSGPFPHIELPVSPFEAILACRVLHFFDGETLEQTADKMFGLLVPGGKVFIRVISAYTQVTKNFIPEFERRKAAGEKWPGFVADGSIYMTDEQEVANVRNQQMNFLEPDVLANTFRHAGFAIERCEYVPVNLDWVYLDGRESVVMIAGKPL